MPDMERHWLAETLAYLSQSFSKDTMLGQKVKKVFFHLKSNPKAKDCHRLRGEALFVHEYHKALCNLPGSSDLSRAQKELYWELVVGSA